MYIPVTAFLRERKPRFFEGLDVADVRTIMAAATQQRFSANSVIARQGYSAGHLYLLLTGRLRRFFTTIDGQKIVLLRVTAGEVFGEAAVLAKPVEYLVSSEATTNTTALVWSRSTIRDLCARYPRLLREHFVVSFRLSGRLSDGACVFDLRFRSAAACPGIS